MNQKEIKELIEFLVEKDIAEFELQRGDMKTAHQAGRKRPSRRRCCRSRRRWFRGIGCGSERARNASAVIRNLANCRCRRIRQRGSPGAARRGG